MSRRNKKVFTGAIVAALMVGAGSLAYFTDRTEGEIAGQAGSLCITEIRNEHDLEHLAPGDKRPIELAYVNEGSLSMDTRITYVMSYSLNVEVEESLENDIDVIAHLHKDGEKMLTLDKSGDAKVTIDGETLQGTKEKVGEEVLEQILDFEFDTSVGNIGQLMDIQIDVIVEGKQNRNNPEWDVLSTTTYNIANSEVDVVHWSACNVKEEEPKEPERVIKLRMIGVEPYGFESVYYLYEGDVFPIAYEELVEAQAENNSFSILGSRPGKGITFNLLDYSPTFEELYELAESGEFLMSDLHNKEFIDDNGDYGYELRVDFTGSAGGIW